MNEDILEARKLVDQLIEVANQLRAAEQKITDPNFKTDILIIIGQHRHDFEQQGVADHRDCVSIQAIAGSIEGITGGLYLLSDTQPLMRKAIIMAAGYTIKRGGLVI